MTEMDFDHFNLMTVMLFVFIIPWMHTNAE